MTIICPLGLRAHIKSINVFARIAWKVMTQSVYTNISNISNDTASHGDLKTYEIVLASIAATMVRRMMGSTTG